MGQAPFENFDFLVKVKGALDQSIFSHTFFFFFCRRFGSGSDFQVGLDQTRSAGQTGQPDSERWRHGACQRVSKCRRVVARVFWGRGFWTFWWSVAAHGGVFGPEILVFYRSRATRSSGVVRVLKLRAYLRRIERLSHGSLWARGHAWGHMEAHWRMIFLGFVDPSPFNSPVVLVFWSEGQICANFERLFRWSLWVHGRAWERVDSLLSLIFSGSL